MDWLAARQVRGGLVTGAASASPDEDKTNETEAASTCSNSADEPLGPDPNVHLTTTEPALFSLLLRVSRQQPPPRPEAIAHFHAHSSLSHLVSHRTYSLLLHLAHRKAANLRLVHELVDEMEERGLWLELGSGGAPEGRGEWTTRAMLLVALQRGDRKGVSEMLQTMRGKGWGGVAVINVPRNLGRAGKGRGDARWSWKGKGKSKGRVEESAPNAESVPPTTWSRPRSHAMTRYTPFALQQSSSTFHELDHLLRRRPPHMPKDPTRLKAEDAAALVESFVRDEKAPEAFSIAQRWLEAARQRLETTASTPEVSPPPGRQLLAPLHRRLADLHAQHPSPAPIPPHLAPVPCTSAALANVKFARIAYHKTATLLLNILLKSLFSERASLGVIKSFVVDFARANGLPSPPPSLTDIDDPPPSSTPLKPGLTTLRTLLSGLQDRQGGYTKGVSLITWFVKRWGLPSSEWELLALDSSSISSTTRPQFDTNPHHHLEGSAALLLLRLAVADWRRWNPALPSEKKEAFLSSVRGWWAALDKSEGGESVWGTREAKVMECKAVECGLLEERGVLRGVMRSRAGERRKEERREAEERERLKERRLRGVGRGEQKVVVG